MFTLAGVSLRTLVYANLLIAALTTALLYVFARRIASELAATVAALVFVLCICFAQYVMFGNYNWVTPYVHEVTHGGLLGLFALSSACAAFRSSEGRRVRWLIAAGVAAGLVFLTRVELFVATTAGVAVAVAGLRSARAALVVAAAACAVIAAAFALLCLQLSPGEAATGIAASYRSVGVASSYFFRAVSGTNDIFGSLLQLARVAGIELACAGAAAFAALRWPWPTDDQARRRAVAGVAFVAVAAAAWMARDVVPWLTGFRPLPLYVAAIAAASLRPLRIERLAFAVFSLALLAKVLLNAGLHQYGFALAMPALLIVVLALVDWIPQALDTRGGTGVLFRGAALGLIAVFALKQAVVTLEWHASKQVAVGHGADRFRADPRGIFVSQALEQVEALPREATLAVLPEGAMINFLARRRNPTPYLNFMPTEFSLWREADMIAAFERTRPDYILLVHKDTSEYGVRFFGRDYARALFAWITRSYSPIWSVGARPFTSRAFGMLLLRMSAAQGGKPAIGCVRLPRRRHRLRPRRASASRRRTRRRS